MSRRVVGRKLTDRPTGDIFNVSKQLNGNDDFFKDFGRETRKMYAWGILAYLVFFAGGAAIILGALKIAGVI